MMSSRVFGANAPVSKTTKSILDLDLKRGDPRGSEAMLRGDGRRLQSRRFGSIAQA
jgi:hypothetical protein